MSEDSTVSTARNFVELDFRKNPCCEGAVNCVGCDYFHEGHFIEIISMNFCYILHGIIES